MGVPSPTGYGMQNSAKPRFRSNKEHSRAPGQSFLVPACFAAAAFGIEAVGEKR